MNRTSVLEILYFGVRNRPGSSLSGDKQSWRVQTTTFLCSIRAFRTSRTGRPLPLHPLDHLSSRAAVILICVIQRSFTLSGVGAVRSARTLLRRAPWAPPLWPLKSSHFGQRLLPLFAGSQPFSLFFTLFFREEPSCAQYMIYWHVSWVDLYYTDPAQLETATQELDPLL